MAPCHAQKASTASCHPPTPPAGFRGCVSAPRSRHRSTQAYRTRIGASPLAGLSQAGHSTGQTTRLSTSHPTQPSPAGNTREPPHRKGCLKPHPLSGSVGRLDTCAPPRGGPPNDPRPTWRQCIRSRRPRSLAVHPGGSRLVSNGTDLVRQVHTEVCQLCEQFPLPH